MLIVSGRYDYYVICNCNFNFKTVKVAKKCNCNNCQLTMINLYKF